MSHLTSLTSSLHGRQVQIEGILGHSEGVIQAYVQKGGERGKEESGAGAGGCGCRLGV